MPTIPASTLVQVTPSVIAAGGAALDIVGLVLTSSTRVPVNGTNLPTVAQFPNAAAVSSFFGATSTEARIAGGGLNAGAGYFGGFIGSTKTPGSILFAQYNQASVAAYVRGGSVAALTLAGLQGISGTINVVMDGYLRVGGTVSLSAAVSFSNAASIIGTALNSAPTQQASFTASITGTTLQVSALTSGSIAVGQTVIGTGVLANTVITGLLSGAGGTGSYVVSLAQTALSAAMTTQPTPVTVTFDSVSSAFVITSGVTGAASTSAIPTGSLPPFLNLTTGSGAVLSQGAAPATPSAFMNNLLTQSMNWACFMTAFDPDGGVGNVQKQAFSAWKNGALGGNKFAYVCWDTDITPTLSVPAAASLGQIFAANNDSGTCLIYEPSDLNQAAFILGAAASINFTQTGGRITFAFKAQAGLVAGVTDPTTALNLGGDPTSAVNLGNFYNFYGAYAQATTNFTWFQRGFVTGTFKWFDSYINQIAMNNAFQNALLTLLQNSLSIPFSTAGNVLIANALQSTIQQFLNFGAFAPGTISSGQQANVNASAGANIAGVLQAQGYYLQILPATSTTRAARTTPPITFWYLDRGSVQSIALASIEVQ